MAAISELAECIMLDDVTSVYYRSLSFSQFIRSEYDPKTSIESELDSLLEQKLVRQLNWSASICNLDTGTHKASHLIKLITEGKLTSDKLESLLKENYWLTHAFEVELGASSSSVQNIIEKLSCDYVNEVLAKVLWRYFSLQMSPQNQDMLAQVIDLSIAIVKQMQQLAQQQQITISTDRMYHLAFMNAYPMMVLIKLFDKTLISMRQDKLNAVAFECESLKNQIKSYQPTADTVLSFLTFDEFLKPHVLESLNIELSLQSNLINGAVNLDAQSNLLLVARNQVIAGLLKPHNVLTPQQLMEFDKQLGISFSLDDNKLQLEDNAKLWKKLVAITNQTELSFA